MVPGFHCSFLPGMPSSPTPGSSISISRYPMPTLAFADDHRLGTPDTPAIRFTRAVDFVASLVRFRYSLPGRSPPCTDQTGTPSLRGLLLPGFQRIGPPQSMPSKLLLATCRSTWRRVPIIKFYDESCIARDQRSERVCVVTNLRLGLPLLRPSRNAPSSGTHVAEPPQG